MSKKNKSKEPSFSPLGFFSGLACGLFVAFLVYLWSSSLPHPLDLYGMIKGQVNSINEEIVRTDPKLEEDKRGHPTFYQFLPGEEIPIPLPKANDNRDKRIGTEAVYLQVGSFTKFEEADGQKARLALLGIIANIETSAEGGDSLWYRVKIGPLSKVVARNLKERLVREKFDVLVLVKNQ